MPIDLAADFTSVAWRKPLQNAVAGAMVLSGRRSGMFSRAAIVRLSLDYLRECLEVAQAKGAIMGDKEPQQVVDGFRTHAADMGTSIFADREAHRPVEWDIRNGAVVRRGRALGFPMPIGIGVVPLPASASGGPV